MFPEIMMADDEPSLNDYAESGGGTFTMKFAAPSLRLKESIIELLSVKSQVVETANNIPQFIQKLKTNDQVSLIKFKR